MPMTSPNLDIDRLSNQQVADLATELWKRLIDRADSVPSLIIRGADRRPIGYMIPASGAPTIPDAYAEFIAETFRRVDNPPDRFLTVDEFLAALDDTSSGAVPAA
jgi:hypothetical protein